MKEIDVHITHISKVGFILLSFLVLITFGIVQYSLSSSFALVGLTLFAFSFWLEFKRKLFALYATAYFFLVLLQLEKLDPLFLIIVGLLLIFRPLFVRYSYGKIVFLAVFAGSLLTFFLMYSSPEIRPWSSTIILQNLKFLKMSIFFPLVGTYFLISLPLFTMERITFFLVAVVFFLFACRYDNGVNYLFALIPLSMVIFFQTEWVYRDWFKRLSAGWRLLIISLFLAFTFGPLEKAARLQMVNVYTQK